MIPHPADRLGRVERRELLDRPDRDEVDCDPTDDERIARRYPNAVLTEHHAPPTDYGLEDPF